MNLQPDERGILPEIEGPASQLVSPPEPAIKPPKECYNHSEICQKRKAAVQKLLSYFGLGDSQSHEDVKDALRGLWDLSLQQMDQVRWLMTCTKLQNWLGSRCPGMFVTEGETAPTEIHNPLSFTSAFLAQSLMRSCECLVASYFCGLRGSSSSMIDMLNSINSQLLLQISQKRRDIDLSFSGGEWYRRKCRRSTSAAVDLLGQLLALLPDEDIVVILVDSASRLACDIDEIDRGIRKLEHLTQNERIAVKILVSDPLRTSAARRLSSSSVSLPDFVDGSREGVNMAALEGDILPSLQAVGTSSSSSSSTTNFKLVSY